MLPGINPLNRPLIKCEFTRIVIPGEVPESEKSLWNWIPRYVRNDNRKCFYVINRLLTDR